MMDLATRDRLYVILRREGRSLFQYLREVPPWVPVNDRDALVRMRELAGTELRVIESLSKMVQRQHGDYGQLGAFPDFTGYNDAAMHFLLPLTINEQTQLLAELETDRPYITEADAGKLLDELLALKRKHIPELEQLHTTPHSFTTVNV